MNKKLMAVAVAGALAAPGVALAQTTISGKFNVQYGFVSQADTAGSVSRDSADGFNSPASNVRLSGQEKLGGGNTVWFQCETRARWGVDLNPSQANSGICDRNSALGVKGSFGNIFIGKWDTAMETQSGNVRFESTGYIGVQNMMAEDQGQFGISFAQRVQDSINYESPNFSGFSFGLSTTTTNHALNTAVTTGAKGRIYSGYGNYTAGPLLVWVGYEKHDDNQTSVGGADGTSEDMVSAGASYVFGPVKVGLYYTSFDGDTSATTDVSRDSIHLVADWKVTPAGTIRVSLTQADDFEGSDPGAAADDQGAKKYVIAYNHALSKRTSVLVGYSKIDNDSNGQYNFFLFNSDVKLGDSASAFVLGASHSF